MSVVDAVVLIATIAGIALWGVWKTRDVKSGEAFLKGERRLTWPTIGLSVMATQASAITFLSVPGQAYDDGLRFVQFYLGMPIAMVVVAAVFLPIYRRLDVYTAYEYLERRFDVKMRAIGALFFLVHRGLGAGITIYAPAIILSSILGWPLEWTVAMIGVVVIGYTVSGGTEAVSQTQRQQMVVILIGMAIAGVSLVWALPSSVSLGEAARLAGATGRMQALDLELDLTSRYNLWSGLIGGFFLALSYFGTDQSQVQRYLSGKSLTESRLGLLFNGALKIPMQLGILFVGILLFAFHIFEPPPLHFNPGVERGMAAAGAAARWDEAERAWVDAQTERREAAEAWLGVPAANVDEAATARERFLAAQARVDAVHTDAHTLIGEVLPDVERRDTDYVFIHYVLNYLPMGLVGLLVAVILLAAMSSTASELSALGTTTTVDLYRRLFRREAEGRELLLASKGMTVLWGLVALLFAMFASLLDNLIQAVNIIGSIFYGPLLGIFLAAFFLPRVTSRDIFPAAVLGQTLIVVLFVTTSIGYLWYNVIGSLAVTGIALVLSLRLGSRGGEAPKE